MSSHATDTTQHPALSARTTTSVLKHAEAQMRTPLAAGWTITSTTLADLFVEVEMIMWKLLLEQDFYVTFQVNDAANRYVQAVMDDESAGIWCETVADKFLGTPEHGPKLTRAEVASLLRDRWTPPTGSPDDTPNWHRHIPDDTPGAPALASQILVSTLIDVHGLRHPRQITVEVGPRWG